MSVSKQIAAVSKYSSVKQIFTLGIFHEVVHVIISVDGLAFSCNYNQLTEIQQWSITILKLHSFTRLHVNEAYSR
jgi:hypothetical protein